MKRKTNAASFNLRQSIEKFCFNWPAS